MNTILNSRVVAVTAPRCGGRAPVAIIRCAMRPPRDSTPKRAPLKASVLEATPVCHINRKQATEFNQCFLNFDHLDDEHAQRCLTVADQILAVDCQLTSICDDDICTEKSQLDWFKSYMSNAYGV